MPLEIVCLAIVGAYVVLRLRVLADRTTFIARFGALALASLIGEDSVIRAYGAYGYSLDWSVRIDRVPLVVVLVWPVVIDSARELARVLGRGSSALRIAAIASVIVLADASLIEPIAVRAGLWRWTAPGIFAVPLIGIAGWAMFTFGAVLVLERGRAWLVIVVAPLVTHALLVASWWAIFRWVEGAIPDVAAPIAAWLCAVPLTLGARRFDTRHCQAETRQCLLSRAPGALFFFVLLVWTLERPWPVSLGLYALAFTPPYLVLLIQTLGITSQVANRKSATESV